MNDKEHIERKYADILADYKKISEKKTEKGVTIKSFDAIMEELSNKYYLTETTIERIVVRGLRTEGLSNQPKLFDL